VVQAVTERQVTSDVPVDVEEVRVVVSLRVAVRGREDHDHLAAGGDGNGAELDVLDHPDVARPRG
jgi:hypothetical protein